MTTHTVLHAFTTPTRRFAPGQTVTAADLDGPLPIARLVQLGCVAAAAEPAPVALPLVLVDEAHIHDPDDGSAF